MAFGTLPHLEPIDVVTILTFITLFVLMPAACLVGYREGRREGYRKGRQHEHEEWLVWMMDRAEAYAHDDDRGNDEGSSDERPAECL